MANKRRILLLSALSTLGMNVLMPFAHLASANSINDDVRRTLRRFHRKVRGTRELLGNASGVLVFPSVVKVGMGIGGEYGEGVLLIRGSPVDNYNTVSASIGFQLGAQARSIIIVFMTDEALAGFKRIDGWKVGVDGSVALLNVGAGGSVDTSRIGSPIVGFIFDGRGLMYNLTLEGSKISRTSR